TLKLCDTILANCFYVIITSSVTEIENFERVVRTLKLCDTILANCFYVIITLLLLYLQEFLSMVVIIAKLK
ncbi:MAG: hypothetical protein RSC41_07460, partial [Oscillospiraceae bacterium]